MPTLDSVLLGPARHNTAVRRNGTRCWTCCFQESELDTATKYNIMQVPDGNNTHTNYLLSYFVDDQWLRTKKGVPMYLRINSTEFELEELIVQRATEMEELVCALRLQIGLASRAIFGNGATQ